MKKTILITLICCTFCLEAQEVAHVPHIGDSAFASVLTCGPGDEFYTSFGHSALRVCDPAQGIDIAYNYGTFDFDIPHFYWTFAKGNLNYSLCNYDFSMFKEEYAYEGRAVVEQRLKLTNQELNNLFIALETNALPQYRYYQYDFFRDNCATRVRDMVANSLCHRTLGTESSSDTNLSYRNILYKSTEGNLLWWRFLVDITLGARCDHRCTNYEYMFSPIEMMMIMDTMTVSDTRQPLTEPAQLLIPETREHKANEVRPELVFAALFLVVLALSLRARRKRSSLRWLDVTLFSTAFIVSVVVVFLWFFTSHYCTKVNMNILWASPLFLYFAIRGGKSNRWVVAVQCLMLAAAMIMSVTAFFGGLLVQQINIALFWFALTLLTRLILMRGGSLSEEESNA